MKKVILSLFVLGSMAASNASEQTEQPVIGSEGSSKPSLALTASVADMTPVSLDKEGRDASVKKEAEVEGVGEKPGGDDAVNKDKAAGKKAKGSGAQKKTCTIL